MKLVVILLIITLFFILVNTNYSEMFLIFPTLDADTDIQTQCTDPKGNAIECCGDDGLVGGVESCCKVRSDNTYNNC